MNAMIPEKDTLDGVEASTDVHMLKFLDSSHWEGINQMLS